MYIWILNIVILLILSITTSIKTDISIDTKKNILLGIMFFQLLFLYFFKNIKIFPDLPEYLYVFEQSKNTNWNKVIQELPFGPGWNFITKLFSTISSDSSYFLLFNGFIFIISFFLIIKKYSIIVWFSIYLLIATVFYNSFFILRQNLAAAICLFSLPYIIERKPLRFVFFILIASSLHGSALIFSILYFIYPLKINKIYFIFIMIIGVIIFFYFHTLFQSLSIYSIGYDVYFVNELHDIANFTSALLSLSIFLVLLFSYYPFKELSASEQLFFHMSAILLLIEISRIGLPGTIGRLNIYFIISTIILIPNGLNRFKNKLIKYIFMFIIFVLFFILMLKQMNYGYELSL